MKYETPEMEIVAFGVKAAIAADEDYEMDFEMGDFLSKNSMPK